MPAPEPPRAHRFTGAVALCALACAIPAAAQRPIDERLAVQPDAMIRIHNMVGSVRVIGWHHDSIAVTGTASETKLSRFELHTSRAGTKMGIWDTGEQGLGPSHLEIRVPAQSSVWIKTASASIHVSAVTGGLDLYSVNGVIRIEGQPREVYAESMGGDVTVHADTRSARIRTGSGAVSLAGSLLDVSATTVSGNADIDGDGIRRARIESVDGRIVWRGAFDEHASIDITSHAGPVEFVMPAHAGAEFVVNTYEGQLHDGWGVRIEKGGSRLKGAELRFALGTASATVWVRTFKADVRLRRVER
jgi:hypothetical protein